MAAAHDIVAIRSTREILLIGPRLSLHAVPKRELLGEGEVRFRLREAALDPGDPAQLRLALARWGLDTQRTTRTRDLKLCDWIASLVGTGRLRAVIAPDTDTHLAALPKTHVPRAPIAAALVAARDARPANTGKITAEKSPVFAAARSMATPPPMPASMPAVPAPRMPLNVAQLDLEERLMIVLARTVESDRLSDAAKAELQALLAPETIAITVGVLALWAGSHLTPFGYVADAIMLGVGVFFAGRAVLEGGKKIAQFLGLTLSAKTEADLDLAADMLAAAIALLSVKLFAKLLSRGASGLNGGGKAKREKVEPPRPRDPEPKTAKAIDPAPATAAKVVAGDKITYTRGKNTVETEYDPKTGRPISTKAELREDFGSSKRGDNATAIGHLGKDGDHGGHLVAHRFMGDSPDQAIIPQAGNLNTGAWKKMENEWADWIASGKAVRAKIDTDPPGAQRPDSIKVLYEVFDPKTGEGFMSRKKTFKNEAGEIFNRIDRDEM